MSKAKKSRKRPRIEDSSDDSLPSKLNPEDIVYTFFSFDVNIKRAEVRLPRELGARLPSKIDGCIIKEFLPSSFNKRAQYWIIREKFIGFQLFDDQEACSSGGKWSHGLWATRIDCSGRELKIPVADSLHVAEVFDGGIDYENLQVVITP